MASAYADGGGAGGAGATPRAVCPETESAGAGAKGVLLRPKPSREEFAAEMVALVSEHNQAMDLAKRMLAQRSYLWNIPLMMPGVPPAKMVEHFIEKNEDDFAWSPSFHPDFVCRVASHGFLPMSMESHSPIRPHILLPKLHRKRSIMRFDNMHVPGSAKKRARRFVLTLDQQIDAVVQGCHKQHGESWLFPPIVAAIKARIANGLHRSTNVSFHSFELLSAEDGALVAGEIGYCVGASYTSMTGFSTVPSSGTVQCCATGALLHQLGFDFWDLGMQMEYKKDLGAVEVPRADFVAMLDQARKRRDCALALPNPTPANEIITLFVQTQRCVQKDALKLTAPEPTASAAATAEKLSKNQEKKLKKQHARQAAKAKAKSTRSGNATAATAATDASVSPESEMKAAS